MRLTGGLCDCIIIEEALCPRVELHWGLWFFDGGFGDPCTSNVERSSKEVGRFAFRSLVPQICLVIGIWSLVIAGEARRKGVCYE